MTSTNLEFGRLSLPHRTIRVVLLLLPVWILGVGELSQFAWKNTVPGPLERTGLVKGRDFVQFYAGGKSRSARVAGLSCTMFVRSKHAVAAVVPAAEGSYRRPRTHRRLQCSSARGPGSRTLVPDGCGLSCQRLPTCTGAASSFTALRSCRGYRTYWPGSPRSAAQRPAMAPDNRSAVSRRGAVLGVWSTAAFTKRRLSALRRLPRSSRLQAAAVAWRGTCTDGRGNMDHARSGYCSPRPAILVLRRCSSSAL